MQKIDKLIEEAVQKIPELNKWLIKIMHEAERKGYTDFIAAASDKKHPLGGGSVHYNKTKPLNDNPIWLMRQALEKWERKHGYSTTHDWRD
jgi:hypothetical protein